MNKRYQIWWQHRQTTGACETTADTLREAIDASRELHELTGYTVTVIDTQHKTGGAVIIGRRQGS